MIYFLDISANAIPTISLESFRVEHHKEGALSTTYCNLLKACLGAVLHKSVFYSLFNAKKAIGWLVGP